MLSISSQPQFDKWKHVQWTTAPSVGYRNHTVHDWYLCDNKFTTLFTNIWYMWKQISKPCVTHKIYWHKVFLHSNLFHDAVHNLQYGKFAPFCQSEGDNFGGGPETFVDISSILCLWFEIQGMRTYNFLDGVSNTDKLIKFQPDICYQTHDIISYTRLDFYRLSYKLQTCEEMD